MEIESNSFVEQQEDFRKIARDFGITGETIARMALSPDRALACVEAAQAKYAGPGLAVHMFDAGDPPTQRDRKQGPKTNLAAPIPDCDVCGGDRFVRHSERAPQMSAWMREHKISPNVEELIEVLRPCPNCGPTL